MFNISTRERHDFEHDVGYEYRRKKQYLVMVLLILFIMPVYSLIFVV